MDFFYIVHMIICILLIVVVLFQDGKAGGLTSVADSSQAVFGAKGATNFLTKLTSILAIVFMCSSLFLAFKEAPREKSIASDFVPETTSTTDDTKATSTGDKKLDASDYEVVPLDQVPDEVLSEQDRALKAQEEKKPAENDAAKPTDQKPADDAAKPADQKPAEPPAGQ